MTSTAPPTSSRPLVSIGVPTCDRADLLRRALDSLLAQRYPNLEIVVSDNASTDATPDVCAEVQSRAPYVRYHRVAARIPVFANFRNALAQSHGTYFMWASDDDQWEPEFVSTLVDLLGANNDLMLAAAEARYVLPDGTHLPLVREGAAFYSPAARSRWERFMMVANHAYGNLIYGVYRREALIDPDGRTALDACEFFNEIPVFIQVADRGGIRVCERVLFYKTAPLRTFLHAARLQGVSISRSEGAPALPTGSAGAVERLHRLFGYAARTVAYHVKTFADIRRAVRRANVGFGSKVALLVIFAARLTAHFLRVAVVWPAEDAIGGRHR